MISPRRAAFWNDGHAVQQARLVDGDVGAVPERPARPISPTDPMSFPPGLIPELVRTKLETDPPYSPLSTLEVDRAGLPEPRQPDAYLRSRLDKFYAELKVCQPLVDKC